MKKKSAKILLIIFLFLFRSLILGLGISFGYNFAPIFLLALIPWFIIFVKETDIYCSCFGSTEKFCTAEMFSSFIIAFSISMFLIPNLT